MLTCAIGVVVSSRTVAGEQDGVIGALRVHERPSLVDDDEAAVGQRAGQVANYVVLDDVLDVNSVRIGGQFDAEFETVLRPVAFPQSVPRPVELQTF